MPNAVLRSLSGMLCSLTSRRGAGAFARSRGVPHAARRDRARRPHTVAGEALEDRRLFALGITPQPATVPPTALGAALLVPNTGLTLTGGTYVGVSDQGATFTGFDMVSGNTRLNIQDGVLLTTGRAIDALGPNDLPGTSTAWATAGDPDLALLTRLPTFDANSLTLNFTTAPGTRSVLFDFIFGSEEFSEFVGNNFNDAFGAYVDGVQVTFDINNRPITVNNNFFRVNNITGAFAELEYDGLTPRIRTTAPLNPTITNHTLKFVLADSGDDAYDSGVFIGRLQGSTTAVVAPITELPNPGTVAFSAPSFTVDETAGLATILVSRLGGTSGQATVNYTVTGGTATDLVDFTPVTGTLIFADGQTSLPFTVPVIDDLLAEGDETVQLTLSAAVDAGLGSPSTATLTILDNELAITFIPATYTVDETMGTATLTVSRSGSVDAGATVAYATAPDPAAGATQATASADFIATSGTVTFAPGQRTATVPVQIIGDFEDEETTETLAVALSAPTGAALGVANVATVSIVNVDRPPSIYDISAFAPSGRIEALFLKVNDPVQAAVAIDPATYDLYQHAEKKFNGPPSRQRVAIRAVDYNPSLRTLVIRPARPLKNNVFYEVTVRGTTDNGLTSVTSEGLDGNLDRVTNFTGEDFIGYFGRGNRLTYNDRDGTKVKLGATGGGVIEVFRDASRDARTVRYLGANAASSIFGTVTPTWRGSDRFADIGTLVLGGARNFLGNPPFRVAVTI